MEVKLKRVRRLDSIKLNEKDKTYFTEEGYLVDHPILTSVGIFEYLNLDGSIRKELRLPEHVFSKESLRTYKGKPIIITHDAGVVDKKNVEKEQIGTILTAGYQDGEDVRAEIIIHNTDAMKDSRLKELSLGYSLDLIEEPGEFNGEHYDAIQTNIIINHLALVENARAGEQARLNIDGSTEPELKGGKKEMEETKKMDTSLSPEELKKAIEDYKAKKAETQAVGSTDGAAEEKNVCEEKTDNGIPAEEKGNTPQEIAQLVKDRKDKRDSEYDPKELEEAVEVIKRQDEDIDMLLACLENLLTAEKMDSQDEPIIEEKADSADDDSKSLNADSADQIFRQRLGICRVGDKLNMDGLESKSIIDGKKAIVKKVLPEMRLDGKSKAYIDAAYDMAVAEVNKRKDCDYQRDQMTQKQNKDRFDGKQNISMASSARQRMIEREGGNQ